MQYRKALASAVALVGLCSTPALSQTPAEVDPVAVLTKADPPALKHIQALCGRRFPTDRKGHENCLAVQAELHGVMVKMNARVLARPHATASAQEQHYQVYRSVDAYCRRQAESPDEPPNYVEMEGCFRHNWQSMMLIPLDK